MKSIMLLFILLLLLLLLLLDLTTTTKQIETDQTFPNVYDQNNKTECI